MGNIIGIVLVLHVILTIHELGHYWAARRVGFPIQTVCFGLGKPIVTWKRGSTTFAIAPVPLGGYVKMDDEAYAALPGSQKAWIAFGGPMANIIFVVILVAVLFTLNNLVKLGITAFTPFMLLKSVITGVKVLVEVMGYLLDSFTNLSQYGGITEGIVGPIGLANQVQSMGKLTFSMWLALFSALSANVALFNLLPFPALDGSRIAFALLEMAIGRPITKEETIHQWGFILLLTFGLFLTLKDTLTILISLLF